MSTSIQEDLSTTARVALELLAISYEGMTRTQLTACLASAGQPRLKATQLDPFLDELERAGLIDWDRYARCREGVDDPIVRELVQTGRFEALAEVVRQKLPADWSDSQDPDRSTREVRYLLYSGQQDEALDAAWRAWRLAPDCWDEETPLSFLCAPLDPVWLARFSPMVRAEALSDALALAALDLREAEAHLACFEAVVCDGGADTPALRAALAEQLLLRGRFDEAATLLQRVQGADSAQGLEALCRGQVDEAVRCFARALKSHKLNNLNKNTSPRPQIISVALSQLLYPVACLLTGDLTRVAEALLHVTRMMTSPSGLDARIPNALQDLAAFMQYERGGPEPEAVRERALHGWGYVEQAREEVFGAHGSLSRPLDGLILALVDRWTLETLPTPTAAWLERTSAQAQQAGYQWFAAQLDAIRTGAPVAPPQRDAWKPLVSLRTLQPPWRRALGALAALAPGRTTQAEAPEQSSRLAWFVTISALGEYCQIEAKEQRRSKKGGWTGGRAVALKRLYESRRSMSFLSALDHRICALIDLEYYRSSWRGYSNESYSLPPAEALPLLVEHPLVFWSDDPSTPVEVIQREVVLAVEQRADGYFVSLDPPIGSTGLKVWREATHQLVFATLPSKLESLSTLLHRGLRLPAEALPELDRTLLALSDLLPIRSPTQAGKAVSVEVPCVETLFLGLRALDEGSFCIRPEVMPLGEQGPSLAPGRGQATVVGTIDGVISHTTRELSEERQRIERLIEHSASLRGVSSEEAEWALDDLGACLGLLRELDALPEDLATQVQVRWLDAPLTLVGEVGEDALALSLSGAADGFRVSGALELPTQRSMGLTSLLELLHDSPTGFIALDEGRYVALSEALRRHLETLARFGAREGQDDHLELHRLAAHAIMPLVEAAGQASLDEAWLAHVERLARTSAETPTIPKTFAAQLRPYQEDGFVWMHRLASWGAGACLADDMGLGKTVQTLALLTERAPQGPALVVCPASVCSVWQEQAERFAPALRLIMLHGADRGATLEALAPFDVIVCSYGLLRVEREALSVASWATLVLDEAQAIKNPASLNWSAANALRADFRLALTGTPVENHLGELWSLFAFLNPGLLGSQRRFDEQVRRPIERDGDREAAQHLRRLLLPYILRRTKAEVLDELPERAEVELRLTLSPEEAIFYEQLRERALQELLTGEAGHMQVFAWLTRLRRACAHPSLAGYEGPPLGSAKLDALEELLMSMGGQGHRALIFSQFVDSLTLVRERLDALQISYQYLDGSTTQAQRRARVAAFQSGVGEVFLISLRAGGVGLNLTAADYVIHMDPWWNPAVEDQASDRVYRIGQQRPVTIYRLIAEGTIEARIVALHHRKRALAEGLLSGADQAGALSVDELIALIREGVRT